MVSEVLFAVASINTNDTMTCIVGENIRQKVQSLTRVCVRVCVGWWGWGCQLQGAAQRKCSVLDWFERV